MIAFTVPAIAFAVYIAQFKEDFDKKDLDLLIPVSTALVVLSIAISLLGAAL